MLKKNKKIIWLIIAFVLSIAIAALALNWEHIFSAKGKDKTTIKLGYLPTHTAAAMLVAAEANTNSDTSTIHIEMVRFSSGSDMVAALRAKQIDGTITDSASTLQQVSNSNLVLIGIVRRSRPGNPMFTIYGPTGATIEDMNGAEIATGLYTISDYSLDKMLEKAGLSEGSMKKTNVSDITVRVKLLLNGSVDYIVSITQYDWQIVDSGKTVLYTDEDIPGIHNYLALEKSICNYETFNEIRCLYDNAAKSLNENPEKYRAFLSKYIIVPEGTDIIESMPDMEPLLPPDVPALDDIIKWLVKNDRVSNSLKAEDLVDLSLWENHEK